jgi:hypothetical protein
MLRIPSFLVAAMITTMVPLCSLAQELPLVYPDPAVELADNNVDTTKITVVRAVLDTSSETLAPFAAMFLAQRGYSDIAPQLRARVTQSLISESNSAVPSLTSYLMALYILRDAQTIPLLRVSLDTLLVRRATGAHQGISEIDDILTMLVNLRDYSGFGTVTSLLQAPDQLKRPVIVKILAAHAADATLRPSVFLGLRGLLNQPNEVVRWNVIRELRKFKDYPETKDVLRQLALSDSSFTVRQEGIVALFTTYGDYDYVLRACEIVALKASEYDDFTWSVRWLQYVISPNTILTLRRIHDGLLPGQRSDYIDRQIESYVPVRPLLAGQIQSVAASLDSLVSYKHQVESLIWLADANFVKELDNGLDNAKKHLAKGDSVNAYKEVQTFQGKVNDQYQKTIDDQKKGKPRDKRFVTVEGWKFLYYNAQYIMDRLPSGKK